MDKYDRAQINHVVMAINGIAYAIDNDACMSEGKIEDYDHFTPMCYMGLAAALEELTKIVFNIVEKDEMEKQETPIKAA